MMLLALPARATPIVSDQPGTKPIPDEVSAQYDARDLGRYIVLLESKADLTDAGSIANLDQRRIAVVESLRTTAGRSQAALIGLLELATQRGQVSHYQSFWVINAIAVESTEKILNGIATRPEVKAIVPDERRYIVFSTPAQTAAAITAASDAEWNIDRVGAPAVWDAGIDGSGAVVANIDTGVDFTHSELFSKYRGADGDHNYDWRDSVNGQVVPYDDNNHGTHTMGTMVGGDGKGPNTGDIGMAPGANWIAAKAFSGGGYGLDSWILDSAQFLTAPTRTDGSDPRPELAPDVINNSWGGGSCDAWFEEVLTTWRTMSIFPAFAIGNSGTYGAGSPGDSPQAFGVGATDSSDEIAYFSSTGPSCYGETKPEISAPGVFVRSSIVGGYASYSGTSMATPHVAGAVALMLHGSGATVSVGETEAILTETALDLGSPGPDNSYGWGRLQAFEAVQLVVRGGILEGTVSDSLGAPIQAAKVTAASADRTYRTTTKSDGSFKLRVVAGDYTVSASAFGYLTASQPGLVAEGGATIVNFSLADAPWWTISGTVTAGSGEPLTGAKVVVEETPLAPAFSDAMGKYSITVPEGNYKLTADKGLCFSAASAQVGVAGDVIHDFHLDLRIDDFGYRCDEVAFSYDSGTAKLPLSGLDQRTKVNLPFPFPFYEDTYGSLWVTTNGYLSFLDMPAYYYINRPIPDTDPPNGTLYPLWDDMFVRGAERGVYTATFGEAPNRWFVIEYRNFELTTTGDLVNFEVVLFENGKIEFRYGRLEGSGEGQSATVGVEGPDGTLGLQYFHNTHALSDFSAIRFDVGPIGRFVGTVTSGADALPVAGASVRTGSRQSVTSSAGSYRLSLPPGTYTLEASAPGYKNQSAVGSLTDGAVQELNFVLPAPRVEWSPAEVVFEPAEGSQSASLNVSNTGVEALSFSAIEAKFDDLPVVIDDEVGDNPLSRVDVSTIRAATEAGLSKFEINFAKPVTDDDLSGELLVDTDQSQLTGVPPSSWYGSPTQDVGAEYVLELYGVGWWDAVSVYTGVGDYIATVPAEVTSTAIKFSVPLAYLGNDDGQFNIAGWVGWYGHFFDPEPVRSLGTDFVPNSGHGTVEDLASDVVWLSVDPGPWTLAPGEAAAVAVTVDPSGLEPGEYRARVILLTDDPRRPKVEIPVTLKVGSGASSLGLG